MNNKYRTTGMISRIVSCAIAVFLSMPTQAEPVRSTDLAEAAPLVANLGGALRAPLPELLGTRAAPAFEALAAPLTRAAPDRARALDSVITASVPSAVFGSVALPFRNLPAAKRWSYIYSQVGLPPIAGCEGDSACLERGGRLQGVIEEARQARFLEKLRMVTAAVNDMIAYAADSELYGTLDYWATPSETLLAGRGDCEDYAILKMAALKAAGIPSGSMSLVVLRDRERDFYHAVLAVTTDQGYLILDNLRDAVVVDRRLPSYQPLFSVSQDRSWIHGVRRAPGDAIAARRSPLGAVAPGEGFFPAADR